LPKEGRGQAVRAAVTLALLQEEPAWAHPKLRALLISFGGCRKVALIHMMREAMHLVSFAGG
jgi:hypothetical protein